MKKALTPEEIRAIIAEKIPAGTITPEHTEHEHWYRHNPSGVLLPSSTGVTGMLDAPHLKKWAAGLAVDFIEEHLNELPEPGSILPLRAGAVMAHEDVFHDAGDIGTQGHGCIEQYLLQWLETGNQPEDITKFIVGEDYRLWAICRSAQHFFKKYFVIPIASELKVAYVPKRKPETGYAGTLDALMMVAFPVVKPVNPCTTHNLWLINDHWEKFECLTCGGRWEYHFTLVDFKTSNDIWKDEYYMQVSAYWKAFKSMTGITPSKLIILRLDKANDKYEVSEVLKPARAYMAFSYLRKVHNFISIPEKEKAIPVEGRTKINISDL